MAPRKPHERTPDSTTRAQSEINPMCRHKIELRMEDEFYAGDQFTIFEDEAPPLHNNFPFENQIQLGEASLFSFIF